MSEDPTLIAYRAMLDVPRDLVRYVARLLRAERRRQGTRKGSRVLTCGKQATFVLVWFRTREDLAVLGAGFGISRAAAYRYRAEALDVLAAQAPERTDALDRVRAEGWSPVVVDGTVIDADRGAANALSRKGETIDTWYAGKIHGFGGNIQAVLRPDGLLVWVAQVEPGSVHDLTAARTHALPALYATAAAGLPTRADPGYQGAGIGVHTPPRPPADGSRLDVDTRTYNALLRARRCQGERGFALLTGRWRALHQVTASPPKIGDIAKAALVLTHVEHRHLPC